MRFPSGWIAACAAAVIGCGNGSGSPGDAASAPTDLAFVSVSDGGTSAFDAALPPPASDAAVPPTTDASPPPPPPPTADLAVPSPPPPTVDLAVPPPPPPPPSHDMAVPPPPPPPPHDMAGPPPPPPPVDMAMVPPPACPAPPTTLASGLAGPTLLAVDDQWAYVLTPSNGSLWRIPKSGGAPSPITTSLGTYLQNGTLGYGLAVDATYVYVMRSGTGGANPSPGGVDLYDKSAHLVRHIAATEPAGDCHVPSVLSIAVEAGDLYWVQSDGSPSSDCPFIPSDHVVRVPAGAATGTTVAVGSNKGAITGMTVDPYHVFWADADGISRVPRTGGDREIVVANVTAGPLFSDGSDIFFIDSSGVERVPAPGVVDRLFAGHAGWVAPDGPTHVYFTSGNIQTAAILRVDDDGSGLTSVAQGASVMAVAVDPTYVYYFDDGSTKLLRACK